MQTQTQKHSFDDIMYDTHTVHAHVVQGFESLDPGGRCFANPTHKLVSQSNVASTTLAPTQLETQRLLLPAVVVVLHVHSCINICW